jgi:phenylacetate-CoA ligase
MNPKLRQQQVIKAFEDFLSTPLETILQRHLDTQTSAVLSLFHDVATNVPAYKAFLAEREINPATIQTLSLIHI